MSARRKNPAILRLTGYHPRKRYNQLLAAEEKVKKQMIPCPDCNKICKGARGLAVHRRSAHPVQYHRETQPAKRKRPRWDTEEMLLLAREELRLENEGRTSNINKRLQEFHMSRIIESNKALRSKSRNSGYLKLLAELRDSLDRSVPISSYQPAIADPQTQACRNGPPNSPPPLTGPSFRTSHKIRSFLEVISRGGRSRPHMRILDAALDDAPLPPVDRIAGERHSFEELAGGERRVYAI